jgi:hypothetical protein
MRTCCRLLNFKRFRICKVSKDTTLHEQNPSWETNNSSSDRKIYRTGSFITVFTAARHQSLSRTRWIQSTSSHPVSFRSTLILSSHLCLPSGLYHSRFPSKMLYARLTSHMYATSPAHLVLLDLITLIISGDKYKLWSFALCIYMYFTRWLLLKIPLIVIVPLLRQSDHMHSLW